MNTIRALSLLAATLTMGLATGAFALYAHTIMPGLKDNDDRTFVAAFQSMDRAIINPWFMISAFAGALVCTVVAAIANRGTTVFPWAIAALVLYLLTVVVTIEVNVPLNDALKAAGDPAHIDVAQARAAFDESRWALWNLVRVLASTSAFGLLAWSLVVLGRSTA